METEATDSVEPKSRAPAIPDLSELPVPLERDVFVRTLLRHLAGALQDVVGLEEAAGFVSIVGQKIGDEINTAYRGAMQIDSLSKEQVAAVCVDLKRRIQGDFFVLEMTDEKIVFGNRACPFAEKVIGRPSLCMMTSNVFGSIAAENLGYGKVVIDESIAKGHDGCLVTIYLKPGDETRTKEGREYFRTN
ncbi:methanogen output domain 1-containing protein [Oligoflexus tunisiensis]|uniref:methanogen output domain 1-containing protein n=1 Tax=Oligoflexus tunisiensis TaxID=708132 RepID=UPI000B0BABF1|nr:methanogen output domain 1-containing protein [Oligoflexus tunisiensis]